MLDGHDLKVHNCHRCNFSCCPCSKLESTQYINYLDITVDSHLKFSEHIELLTERIRKLIVVFKNMRDLRTLI